MSAVWSGAWVAQNIMAVTLLTALVVAVLIVAQHRLGGAVRPLAVAAAAPSAPVVWPGPERFRTSAGVADDSSADPAAARRSRLASPPGTHPPLLAAVARPAIGSLPGPDDAPNPPTQCFVATSPTTMTTTPARNARLR